jgi:hypothetical protein
MVYSSEEEVFTQLRGFRITVIARERWDCVVYLWFWSFSASFTFLFREFWVAQAVKCLTTGWMIGIWSPTGAEDFSSSPCVQTGSGAHPASCTMGTGGPFPGGKARPGHDADHSPPHLVPRLRMSRSYTSCHPMRLHGVWRDHFTFLFASFALNSI